MSSSTVVVSAVPITGQPTLYIPEHVRQRLESNGQLQVLPYLAVRAVRIAEDPDCSINDFVGVVERDVSLVTGILRFANSAFYSSGKPLINVRQAAIRLGVKTCRNLILTSCISSLMGRMSMKQEWIREALARHGFLTATICQHLNKTLRAGFDGEEFTGGLVHDIGRTLLATCFTEEFLEFDPMTFIESSETVAVEQNVLGTHHGEVGAYFAHASGLPDSLIDVIQHHHSPAAAKNQKLAALIAAADHMANHLQRFDAPEDYVVADNAAIGLLGRLGVENVATTVSQHVVEIMKSSEAIAEELTKL